MSYRQALKNLHLIVTSILCLALTDCASSHCSGGCADGEALLVVETGMVLASPVLVPYMLAQNALRSGGRSGSPEPPDLHGELDALIKSAEAFPTDKVANHIAWLDGDNLVLWRQVGTFQWQSLGLWNRRGLHSGVPKSGFGTVLGLSGTELLTVREDQPGVAALDIVSGLQREIELPGCRIKDVRVGLATDGSWFGCYSPWSDKTSFAAVNVRDGHAAEQLTVPTFLSTSYITAAGGQPVAVAGNKVYWPAGGMPVSIDLGGNVTNVAGIPESNLAVVTFRQNNSSHVAVIDLTQRTLVFDETFSGPSLRSPITVSRDGRFFAAGIGVGFQIYAMRENKPVRLGTISPALDAAFDPPGMTLAALGLDGRVQLISLSLP